NPPLNHRQRLLKGAGTPLVRVGHVEPPNPPDAMHPPARARVELFHIPLLPRFHDEDEVERAHEIGRELARAMRAEVEPPPGHQFLSQRVRWISDERADARGFYNGRRFAVAKRVL